MRNTAIIFILLLLFSCGNESAKQNVIVEDVSAIPPYDTIAVDSFSQGATSVDIARRIKISSIKYQDSLKQIEVKNEEEQLLKKAKEEKLNMEKKTTEAEKKAKASTAKEKLPATSPTPEPAVNP